MGFDKEAKQYADELQRRFPDSSWCVKAKKRLKQL
jgi:TolA-binding protein